ncbi:DUF6236 family protein [Actinophytocola sp. NPDC049390]|uniref:DUF6236 family protein n=1 Tax=Actinophytocola sp. NPDC049390 TaxID=3363894 RepID=UPI00379D4125
MDPIALYYPYIHVRDDTWLKYASLYWPKMARLRPYRYRTFDSPVARALHNEANWLINIWPPRWAAEQVGLPFLDLINAHSQELRDRFGLDRIGLWKIVADRHLGLTSFGKAMLDRRLGYIHADKLTPNMIEAAVDARLAIIDEGWGGTWVGMHPDLASAYTCALIERIAIENHLHPVTDQPLPHSAVSGWTLDRLVQVLIDRPSSDTDATGSPRDLLDAFVLLAFETVIPANLEQVPIEKIIQVRSRFGAELDTFREYVTQQTQRLSELQDIRDLAVFQEYLRTEVQHSVTSQLTQLRERLRSVGLESTRALVNVKSVALPPLAAMTAETIGLSPEITGPAALAACIVTAPAQWRRQRRTTIRESPVGYLFQIDQALNPDKLIGRLRRTWPA